MALSARDRRIITAIEQNLQERDPRWTRRFARRLQGFERLERRLRHQVRRRVLGVVLAVGWIVLLGADDAHGPGPLLWAPLALTGAAGTAAAVRRGVRRHRYGRRPVEPGGP